ncbi:MAG: hypothetical protein IPH50_02900, partial [Rhodanobacteraceae bacterium]|nr:hypothetical protein [Rhodanobacteraceae bacterium]
MSAVTAASGIIHSVFPASVFKLRDFIQAKDLAIIIFGVVRGSLQVGNLMDTAARQRCNDAEAGGAEFDQALVELLQSTTEATSHKKSILCGFDRALS